MRNVYIFVFLSSLLRLGENLKVVLEDWFSLVRSLIPLLSPISPFFSFSGYFLAIGGCSALLSWI